MNLLTIVDGDEKGELAEADQVRGMYIVSIVGRSATRTLHRVGECYRQPGVHYGKYELLGGEIPKPDMYHQACRECFPKGKDEFAQASDESGLEDVSSSDNMSGEE